MAEQLEPAAELSPSAAVVSLPPASVSAVTVKIPPFWPADPQVWFAQVEAQFSTRNITSQRTKFDHVVAALAPEFATEVRDLLLQPPADTPYDVLRAQLIKRTAASEQRRLRQLFTAEELGDRTPSQLLRRLQQLLGDAAGPNPDNTFLRELFLQRLPGHVRMVLASSGDIPLEALATLADKVMEVASPSVSSVNVAPLTSEVGQLRSEVTQLREMIAALKIAPATPTAGRGHAPSLPRQQAPVPAVLLHPQRGTPHLPASAGIIAGLGTPPASAPPPVRGRETARPGVDGDQHLRPITESPVLRY